MKRDTRRNVAGRRYLMYLIITHVEVRVSNRSVIAPRICATSFRHCVPGKCSPACTMFLRIDGIISRLREPARHNIFANLRYKRPVNLLVTREFQRTDARSGDLTPRACQDYR